jgi:hypothetical protein
MYEDTDHYDPEDYLPEDDYDFDDDIDYRYHRTDEVDQYNETWNENIPF